MKSNAGDLIANKKVIVVCGSGGVGKTTVSAALGLLAARGGANSLTLTIDPARRLADALGLDKIGNNPTRISDDDIAGAGVVETVRLSAMMLDAKTAWDQMITRFAPTTTVRDRIFKNRLYQNLSAAFSGGQDYAAAETLFNLADSGEYDLIVLDTPPAAHALDFLDAPHRLVELLNDNMVSLFLKPTTAGLSIFSRGGGAFLGFIEKLTGVELIRDISDFFSAIADLAGSFKTRANAMVDLLKSEDTLFLVVSGPDRLSINEALAFCTKLREMDLPFGGFIVNRLDENYLSDPEVKKEYGRFAARIGSSSTHHDQELCPPEVDALLNNFSNWARLAEVEETALDRLRESAPDRPIIRLPRFAHEIADLEGIARLSELLDDQ